MSLPLAVAEISTQPALDDSGTPSAVWSIAGFPFGLAGLTRPWSDQCAVGRLNDPKENRQSLNLSR